MNLFHNLREWFFKRSRSLPADASRAERGRYGEALAANYCREQLRYRLIARNWRHKRDEIDLICRDGEVLVFIEVRARSASSLVSGFYSVDRKKKKVLQRAAKSYLKQLQNPPKHFRFDIIDVALTDGEPGKVRHYANVPLFSKHYQPGP